MVEGAVAYDEATDSGAVGYEYVRDVVLFFGRSRSSSSLGLREVDEDTTDSGRLREEVDSALRRPLLDELSLSFPVSLLHILTVCPRSLSRRAWCKIGKFWSCCCGAAVLCCQIKTMRLEKPMAGKGYQAGAVSSWVVI